MNQGNFIMAEDTIENRINWIIAKSKDARVAIVSTFDKIKATCNVPVTQACLSYLSDHEINRQTVELFNEVFSMNIGIISRSNLPDIQQNINDLWIIKTILNKKWEETDEAVKKIRKRLKIN